MSRAVLKRSHELYFIGKQIRLKGPLAYHECVCIHVNQPSMCWHKREVIDTDTYFITCQGKDNQIAEINLIMTLMMMMGDYDNEIIDTMNTYNVNVIKRNISYQTTRII